MRGDIHASDRRRAACLSFSTMLREGRPQATYCNRLETVVVITSKCRAGTHPQLSGITEEDDECRSFCFCLSSPAYKQTQQQSHAAEDQCVCVCVCVSLNGTHHSTLKCCAVIDGSLAVDRWCISYFKDVLRRNFAAGVLSFSGNLLTRMHEHTHSCTQ